MNAPIPIALIGTGFSASIYVEALRLVPQLQLVTIVGRELGKAKILAEKAGISHHTDDIASVLRSNKISGVILAVPPFIQPSLAIEAFHQRKHVLCEKPLALTPKEAEDVLAAWKTSDCIGMTNFCYRLIPEIVELKKRIRLGDCGDLQSLQVDWVLSSRLNRTLTYNWKTQKELGGGVLLNYGVHVIDYLFHDQPDVAVGCATRKVHIKTRPDTEGNERQATADEVVTALFRLENSITAVMHLSLVTTPPTGHRIVARGSAGTLEVHNPDPRSPAGPFCLYRHDDTGNGERELLLAGAAQESTMANLFKRVLDNYAESIRDNVQIGPSIADGARASRLVCDIECAA